MAPAFLRTVTSALALLSGPVAVAQWTAYSLHTGGVANSEVYAVTPSVSFGYVSLASGQVLPAAWTGTNWTNYLPAGSGLSGIIYGVSGDQKVGMVGLHAALWTGGPGSNIDLNPAGIQYSIAVATDGQTQAGYVIPSLGVGLARAAYWNGTAQSMVNLHPLGAYESTANAVAGDLAGGWLSYPTVPERAVLWSRSSGSMTSLHPSGVPGASMVLGMVEGQQVGYVNGLAAVWSGTAASFVSLDPPGAHGSRLYATSGSAQVGYVGGAGFQEFHAGIWFGTAQSFVRLSDFLPAGQYGSSFATSVAERNGVYYVGGYAWVGNHSEAILWVGVPAPRSAALLMGAGLCAARRRRPLHRRQRRV